MHGTTYFGTAAAPISVNLLWTLRDAMEHYIKHNPWTITTN